MLNIIKNMTKEKYDTLVKRLGKDENGNINTIDISINTDRSDPDIIPSVLSFSVLIAFVSKTLNIDHSELKTNINVDESDHEIVSHSLDLNNKVDIGYYVCFQEELYMVTDIYSGVFSLLNIKTKETKATSKVFLEPAKWDFVFSNIE